MSEVRPYEPADEVAVRRLVSAAFGEDGETIADLVTDLRAGPARAELVAVEGADVVGHVMLSRGWVDAREAQVDVLVLSPLSVAPAHQGRGVGTRLLAEALDAARASGAPAVFLEGDPGFYAARGWEPGAAHGFTRPSARIPGPAFQVVVLEAHEDWMRGALVYPEAFWARDCVGLRDPHLAEIEQAFD